jgi:hypothetical protein
MEHNDHMALEPDRVSVRHRVCCCTLLSGRFTRLTLLSVCVNHGSTLELRTTLTVDLGAKAAAEAGSNEMGIVIGRWGEAVRYYVGRCINEKRRTKERVKEVSQADIIFLRARLGDAEETRKGRANEEGGERGGRWRVKKRLVVVEGGIS